MRKILFLGLTALLTLAAKAQSNPVFILTTPIDGQTRTVSIGSADISNTFTVDWGDGNIVDGGSATAVYDGWDGAVSITGTPVGSGIIKIYATGAVSYLDCVSKITDTGFTTLDVTNAKDLTELDANGNKLKSIDLSKNGKLVSAYLNNNSLKSIVLNSAITTLNLQSDSLTSFDGSASPNLKTLYLSNNPISTLDLSSNTNLKSIYLLNMGLTSLNLGNNTTSGLYVSVNNDSLTTLDVTGATGFANTGKLFAMNNKLSELKYSSIGSANLSGNKFTFATLPTIANLIYAPQQAMALDNITESVDLSSQSVVGGAATTYAWYTTKGDLLKAGTDYTEDKGKFVFIKDQADSVYCTMTNATLPKFTGTSIFKTVTVKLLATTGIKNVNTETSAVKNAVFTIDGKFVGSDVNVETLEKGVYVVRKGDKVFKVAVKS